jgi:hypothetical protein
MTKEDITREKEIIMRRLYGQTLTEIGRNFGITKERVRQLEERIQAQSGTILGVHESLIKDLAKLCKIIGVRQAKVAEIAKTTDLTVRQVVSGKEQYSAGLRVRVALSMLNLCKIKTKIMEDCVLEVSRKMGIKE